jgi:hypothetical protein
MKRVLYQSVFSPLRVFNNIFDKSRLQISIIIVIATAFLEAVITPFAYFYTNIAGYDIQIEINRIISVFLISTASWLIVCSLFLAFSKVFKKGIGFLQIVSTWGLSFIPNFICIILYNLLIIKPDIYIDSGFSSFIISTLFIMLLIWKAIYYYMFMRLVLNATLPEIIIITAVSAVVFTALMLIGAKAGIQVPML